jgi:hypothetical protein
VCRFFMWLFLWPILLPLWLWKRGNVGRFFLCLFVSTLLPSNKAQERKTVTPTTSPPVGTKSTEAISKVGKLRETAEAPRTPILTDTPVPTHTPEPINTLVPTKTFEPTTTLEPTNTPRPTSAYAEMEDAPPEMEAPSDMPASTAVPESAEPVPATATAVAQATKVAYACLNASYVADVTVPDGTRFDADVSFVKTWRVKNTGKCDWKQDVVIAFESGDKLDGLSVVPAGALPVGKQVEVSVPMRSPLNAGKYAGAWRMQDSNGRYFGEKLSVLISVGGPVSAPRPANTAVPTRVPAPQALSFRDGLMIVGADITPGTYRSIGGNSCYWERLRGFGGTFDEIIANDNVVGPTIVTIAATDKGFKSSRCNRWTQDLSPITSSPTAPFSDGAFMVNMDIAPGTWRSSGNGGCYWERLRGFSGEFADIIANDNVSESTVVTISPEDAGFSSTRCGTWTKIQ